MALRAAPGQYFAVYSLSSLDHYYDADASCRLLSFSRAERVEFYLRRASLLSTHQKMLYASSWAGYLSSFPLCRRYSAMVVTTDR